MDFKKLIDKAKKTVDDRGGVESLKADAEELKKIASGKGSLTDKAKEAAAAIKDPGARGGSEGKSNAGHPKQADSHPGEPAPKTDEKPSAAGDEHGTR